MLHRLQEMKHQIACAVECELCDIANADTHELGEAIDMIKDLEEAIYYATITEAMNEKNDYHKDGGHKEYIYEDDNEDEYEGHSHKNRRMYMEAKEMHKDKAIQLKELEKYMQELTADIVDMIQDSSPEEKQYLEKKISALATKIGSMK